MHKMFGDSNLFQQIAEQLLELYSLEELLELNNVEQEEVIEILLTYGRLAYPENVISRTKEDPWT